MIPRTDKVTTLVRAIRLNSARTIINAKTPPKNNNPNVPIADPAVAKNGDPKIVPNPSKIPATIQRQRPMMGDRKKMVEIGLARLPDLVSVRSSRIWVNDQRRPPSTAAAMTWMNLFKCSSILNNRTDELDAMRSKIIVAINTAKSRQKEWSCVPNKDKVDFGHDHHEQTHTDNANDSRQSPSRPL